MSEPMLDLDSRRHNKGYWRRKQLECWRAYWNHTFKLWSYTQSESSFLRTVVHGHNLLVYARVWEFYRCIWGWSPWPPLSNNLTPVTRWCFDPKAWVLAFTNCRVSLCPASVHGPLAPSQWGNAGEAEQAFFWKVVRSMSMLPCRVENPCANLLYHLASSRPNRLSLPWSTVKTTASTGRNCKGRAQTSPAFVSMPPPLRNRTSCFLLFLVLSLWRNNVFHLLLF
jgi:hypothetical protein